MNLGTPHCSDQLFWKTCSICSGIAICVGLSQLSLARPFQARPTPTVLDGSAAWWFVTTPLQTHHTRERAWQRGPEFFSLRF